MRDLKCLTVGASCLGENAPLCLSLANSHQSVSLSFIRRATLFCLESLFCAFLHAELQEAFQWAEFQLVCHLSLCFGASACLSFLVPVLFGARFFGASACLSFLVPVFLVLVFLVPVFLVPVHVLVFLVPVHVSVLQSCLSVVAAAWVSVLIRALPVCLC